MTETLRTVVATGRTWTYDLPYTRPPLSLNQRLHWAVKARLTAEVRHYGAIYARQQHIPKLDRYTFVLHWEPCQSRPRDQDSPLATLKPLVDGYCDATKAVDTHDHYVLSAPVIHDPNGRKGRMWVVVHELEP